MSAAERFGAQQIRIWELSIFDTPPRPSVMAVLKGYADDSRPGNKIWAVGGYLGADKNWERFEALWDDFLRKHELPYFHMKEMGKIEGPYAKWQPREEHQEELERFFSDLTQVICDTRLRGFFCITRIDDLNRFNAETGHKLDPYSLAAYGCVLAIASELGLYTTEIIFDHVEKVKSKLCRADEYAASDTVYGDKLGNVVTVALPQNLTFREVRPLQAADFLAWEIQRHHLKNADEWFSIPGKPIEEEARDAHFRQWSRDKWGSDYPVPRKSLQAVMANAQPVTSMIWDYDNLCRTNELRKGVWG